VTKDVEPNGGSARPKRSPKPNPQYSPDNYDLSYVGDMWETRSRRSIQPPIQDDPAHEATAVGHGGVPAVRAEGVHLGKEAMSLVMFVTMSKQLVKILQTQGGRMKEQG
jgi:hypothetical protein